MADDKKEPMKSDDPKKQPMTSEEFKQKILDAIMNLVTLEIVTAVGHVVAKDDSGGPDIADFEKTPMILTKIDLLQGDIKTVFSEEFVTGPYKDLKAFHADREKEGHAIIDKNIAALKALVEFVSEYLSNVKS
jgi:hypothetical protein